MGSAVVLDKTAKKEGQRKKVPKTPLKNRDLYGETLKNLRTINRGQGPKSIYSSLSEHKDLIDIIFEIPKAPAILERIMMKEKKWDDKWMAAILTALIRHREGVELTGKQIILHELLLDRREELIRDLGYVGTDGGEVLVDILDSKNNMHAQMAAALMLDNSEISPKDLERLFRLVHTGTIKDAETEAVVESVCDENLSRLAPHLARRLVEDESVEELIVKIGRSMWFPLLVVLNSDCDNKEKVIRVLGKINAPEVAGSLQKFTEPGVYADSIRAAAEETIQKIQSS